MMQPTTRMTREEAIARLREALIALTDEEHSICQVAAERGIFCGGFNKLDDAELKKRFHWLARKNPNAPRQDIERLANRWQLGRQVYRDVELACDVQQIEHDICSGWDDFSDEDLRRHVKEVSGEEITIVPDTDSAGGVT